MAATSGSICSGPRPGDRLVQLVDEVGIVVAASPNVVGLEPIVELPPAGVGPTFTRVDGLPIEDDSFRVLAQSIHIDGADRTLVVAENTDDLDGSLVALRNSLVLVVPVTVAVLVVIVWWLLGRTLRPVEAIRAQVADIGSSGARPAGARVGQRR